MKKPSLLFVAACLCIALPGQAAQPVADKTIFRAHLGFLADDLLEGRDTGSRGYDISALYVASQFQKYGLQPKGDNGTYLQQAPLRKGFLQLESPAMSLLGKNGEQALVYMDDFLMGPSLLEDQSAKTAPLVFVGYGIQADRFSHDDYAGIDVKGKIAVMLSGKPSRFPTEEGAHFSSGAHKREIADKYGAVGIITLQTPIGEKASPFAKGRETRFMPSMDWLNAKGEPANAVASLQNSASLSMVAAQKLFTEVDVTLDEIYALAEANKPLPRMDLKLSAKMAKKSTRSPLTSNNVVGFIEGSDPKLKHEVVVFSAHLDHVGIVKEKTGDNIYNGAMDNATGIATLIEMARMFNELPVKPKRSMVFIAVTGEEKGLLGADYFARNPTVPKPSIVANVNFDMPILTFDFSSVVAFGAEHSNLKDVAAEAARKTGLQLIPDPMPEQGIFTRSDHYMFVKQGVPSIYLATGNTSFNKTEDATKIRTDFLKNHYHQVSDDLNLPINYDAAARFVQMNFQLALDVANSPVRPAWNKGDFFGDTFKK
jgi:Zn-dependent M28 family amino/carboxypeptidase